MIDVSSRPESIHEQYIDESEEDDHQDTSTEHEHMPAAELADVRSIKSVSSMMSKEESGSKNERATISNRLASIGVLGRLSGQTTSDESGAPSAEASPSKVCLSLYFMSVQHELTIQSGYALLSTLASGRARGASLFGGPEPIKRTVSSDKLSSATPPPEPSDPPMERFMTCEFLSFSTLETG